MLWFAAVVSVGVPRLSPAIVLDFYHFEIRPS